MRALIYDIEIVKAVPNRNEERIEGIEYCEGWGDKANMGISVIGAYDTLEDRYRIFLEDNKEKFFEAAEQVDVLVTFNGIQFDDPVIRACWKSDWVPSAKIYDICAEFKIASGFRVSLDSLCEANFGVKKSGDGAMAPVLWQRGKPGEVIDYCLHDVLMTRLLFNRIFLDRKVYCPKTGKEIDMEIS